MFGKLCSILALTLTVTAVAQVIRFPARVPASSNILTSADITYDGMIRAPASGTDTYGTQGAMTGRVVGGDVHLIFYQSLVGSPNYPGIEEWDITGLTPTTSLGTAPQAELYALWGDEYGATGRRSWDTGGVEQGMTGNDALPKGLYWNETTGLLYGGFSFNYTEIAMWSMWAMSLDDPVTGAETVYGPWRFSYDSTARGDDGTRTHFFVNHPTTGKFCGAGAQKSGNAAVPWGPSLICGADWPISSTTSGQKMTPIELADNYINYYYPNGTYDVDGTPLNTVKQFPYPSTLTHAFEKSNSTGYSLRADPAQNGGIATWGDEVDGSGQPLWFNGTHKQGVIFPVSLNGSATANTADCTGVAHSWYLNASNGAVALSGITGTFNSSTTLTGGTSKATGNVIGYGFDHVFFNSASGDFQVGETASTADGSGTVTWYDNFADCNHGCACVRCATGPVTTLSRNALAVYDPADMELVKNGTIEDYEIAPDNVIDMSPFNLTLAGVDKGNFLSAGWINGTKLYLYAPQADSTKSGNPNSAEILVHVFTIDDSAPPAPAPVPFPVLHLAGAVALWTVGRGRRG
jgi:hypothetical protein